MWSAERHGKNYAKNPKENQENNYTVVSFKTSNQNKMKVVRGSS